MSPESEQQIQNVLTNSGMFTSSQITMAVVTLEPVIAGLEADRDEWASASARLTETREKLEQTIEDMQKAEVSGRPAPQLQDGEPSPFHETPYMTIVPHRSPKMKVHSSLGLARNAISNHVYEYRGSTQDIEILEYKDNRWTSVVKLPKGSSKKDIPWRKK